MKSVFTSGKLAAALAVILFLALNVLFQETLTGAHVDLTEDKLYSISTSTKQVLGELEEPVSLTYFFSESVARDYPSLFSYGRRIRDILREYKSIAGEKLRLEIVEPAPFSEEEDRAVAAGLQAVPTGTGEQIYMGLVVRDLTDREARIPFFAQDREDFLEYDLTKLIANVSRESQTSLSLLTSLPMEPGGFSGFGANQQQSWAIYDQLNELFDMSTLDTDFEAIPESTDLLLIIHPPELDPAQLYAIDQYVLSGGRALVFLDPFAESVAGIGAAARPGADAPESSTLDPLLGAWGLDLADGQILADIELAQRVNMGNGGPQSIKDFPLWIAAGKTAISADDPVTANLEQINLASSGVLSAIEGATTTLEPLISSSKVSALVDASNARGFPDPDRIIRMVEPDDEVYPLIARISGHAMSAFPDGNPAGQDNGEDVTGPAHRQQSDGPINVIIGADTDLFEDRFWVQVQDFLGQRILVPVADNANFIINAIDQMSGSDALIALRGRGVTQRPFTVVEDIRREAEARFRAEEERLQAELDQTEARLAELQSEPGEGDALFSTEQDAEIERFRSRALEVRKQLRDVQRNLVEDITALGNRLAFLNIALVPALLIVAALALTGWRRRQRAKGLAQ